MGMCNRLESELGSKGGCDGGYWRVIKRGIVRCDEICLFDFQPKESAGTQTLVEILKKKTS